MSVTDEELSAYIWCETVLPKRLFKKVKTRYVQFDSLRKLFPSAAWQHVTVDVRPVVEEIVGVILYPLSGDSLLAVNVDDIITRVRRVAGDGLATSMRALLEGLNTDSDVRLLVEKMFEQVCARYFIWIRASIENS